METPPPVTDHMDNEGIAEMTHRLMSEEDRLVEGITDGMVRISAGIESAKDIIADFDRAISGL